MSNADRFFHPFTRLPTELREVIWRECLPKRVCEVDVPHPKYVYDIDEKTKKQTQCHLYKTGALNECPPLIIRVCRESRDVTFQAGKAAWRKVNLPHRFGVNVQGFWRSWTRNNHPLNNWADRVPDIMHLNWTKLYRAEYGADYEETLPILYLAACASAASCRASIMIENLDPSFEWVYKSHPEWGDDSDDEMEDPNADPKVREPDENEQSFISAFKELPSPLVVMQIVVIHMDFQAGVNTGLFGLLGDAPLQIISMVEEAKIDTYFNLARECEQRSPVSPAQDLERRSLRVGKQKLRNHIVKHFGSEELVPLMEPAIMFRLCPLMCNHPGLARENLGCF